MAARRLQVQVIGAGMPVHTPGRRIELQPCIPGIAILALIGKTQDPVLVYGRHELAVSLLCNAPDGEDIVEVCLELQRQAYVHVERVMVRDRDALDDEARYDPVPADGHGVPAHRVATAVLESPVGHDHGRGIVLLVAGEDAGEEPAVQPDDVAGKEPTIPVIQPVAMLFSDRYVAVMLRDQRQVIFAYDQRTGNVACLDRRFAVLQGNHQVSYKGDVFVVKWVSLFVTGKPRPPDPATVPARAQAG